MNCNYKVKITDIQNKYQFKILCKGGANSTNVNDIYNLLPTTTTEGTDISISNTADIKAKSITIKGNTTQDGTPTPASPINVLNVTGLNTINICNKNLFNDKAEVKGGLNAGPTYIGQVATYGGTTYTYSYVKCVYVKAGETYTISHDQSVTPSNTGTRYGGIIDKNNILLEYFITWKNGETSQTFTPTNSGYLVLSADKNATNIQIEKGSTATSYIAHQEKNYIINFGNLEFCKIGTYADYPFEENNKWYKYGAIVKIILDTNTEFTTDTMPSGNPRRFTTAYQNLIVKPANNNTLGQGFSNIGIVTATNTYTGDINGIAIHTNGSLYIDGTTYSNLANTPVVLYAILLTPTITEITDATLIRQLNNISNNIRTFEGGTNISSTSAGANPIINITTFNKLS